MLRKIILDNTVFNRFAYLQTVELFQLLQNLNIEQVLVPVEVRDELQEFADGTPDLAPRLNYWLNAVRPNSFFHLCTIINQVVYDQISGKIGKGEADAIAQSVATSVGVFITDDFDFEGKLPPANYYPTMYSSYFLLAYADVVGFLTENQYRQAFAEMQLDLRFAHFTPETKREHRRRWRTEYAAALRHLSLPLDKKRIQRKVYIR